MHRRPGRPKRTPLEAYAARAQAAPAARRVRRRCRGASDLLCPAAVLTELLNYDLPDELIARRPLEERDASRLLVLDCGEISHRAMREWPDLVPEGALLVVNDTRVRRARVFGVQTSGGALPAVLERLPGGDVLQYAIGDFVTATGQRIEGRGVVPDEVVVPTREELLAGGDPIMEAALRWIAKGR